jgi:hypothetical protein
VLFQKWQSGLVRKLKVGFVNYHQALGRVQYRGEIGVRHHATSWIVRRANNHHIGF